MHRFVRSLITEWRRLDLPFAGETVIVAVSGGADSTSLLAALADLSKRKKLDLRLVAAHFNHHLRGDESDSDEQFVRDLSAEFGFEFLVGNGRRPKGGNMEQHARNQRYDFLRRTAEKFDAYPILTAHTVNDQAETFLMNLIRGSGPDGLSAMQPIRLIESGGIGHIDAQIRLVRPLLRWAKREDTESFCSEVGIDYRSDTMNDDLAFTRVRIRKTLIPLLKEFNPKIIDTLANTSELLSHEETANSASVKPTESLSLKSLKTLTKADMYRTIRSWISLKRGNLRSLQLKHIEAIARLALSRKSGQRVELPGGVVVKSSGELVFEQIKVEK